MASVRKKINRILWDRRARNDDRAGCIDEIVMHDCMVHVERLSERCWWIALYGDHGSSWTGNFTCDSRGRMRFTEQENNGVDWDLDESHEGDE